ncbi:MAG: T9SS type A sorting domain-containing protein, partial [Spirosomataceae bacterium]
LNLTGDMPEWTAFPMPFNDVLNLKTEDEHPTPYQFTLYTVDGRKLEIPQRVVVQSGSLYQINFTDLGLTSGVYIVHVHRDGAVRRTIKVVKK